MGVAEVVACWVGRGGTGWAAALRHDAAPGCTRWGQQQHLGGAAAGCNHAEAGPPDHSLLLPYWSPNPQVSEQEKALKEFMCGICKGVVNEPCSTPCGALRQPAH